MSPCSAPPRLELSWTLDKQSERDKVEGRTGGELREKEVYSNEGIALFFSRCKLTALRGRFSLTGVRTGSYEAALLLSMLVMTALSRSGHTSRATKGPWLPWCHATAVANGVLFISQRQKLTFPKRRCQPTTPLPPPRRKFQAGAKNNDAATVSTWTPFSQKTFLQQQARGDANAQHAPDMHNAVSDYEACSNTCHTCTR